VASLLRLTHANLKERIYVAHALIAGWYHSPGHKCTHIVASGGAVFPALESVEEVERLYNQGQDAPKTEANNGND
jgi:hypothetical protein